MADPSTPLNEELVQKPSSMLLPSSGTYDELLKRYNTALAECKARYNFPSLRIWPTHNQPTEQQLRQLRHKAEQISRLESLVKSLQEGTVKAPQVSQDSILGRLSLLENVPQRLPVPPYETPATTSSVPGMIQATVTATPVVSPDKPVIVPTFAAVTARRSQPSTIPTVLRQANPVVIRDRAVYNA
ncbi:hypothetical protein RvY_00628 [Ramazzottius varieornatus]|uniref:Uncharacterized protein n=1 Tax=Ramazzottius varieornatus TaxID=947166 RepID=A0A1D1UEC3_RAMVA|nr:hypothetical protein RvY_00628 [Ramazzottius varieornatus]